MPLISLDQYQVDEVYKDGMDRVCGSCKEEEKYVEGFGGET